MYLEHFGLREAPFRITPHTEFFFSGAHRGTTLEALIYAITQDEGIVKVTGEVGSGKTMLCRMLLEKLPPDVETVYLANPSLSRNEILHVIAEELKVELPDDRPHLLLRRLQAHLIDIYASNRQVVVMVDEAHAMPAEALEEIRLLSNLETNRHKLLHIVLFGQPELDGRLASKNMRQLKERITHNFALGPLHRNDIGRYVMFRMRAAGYHGPDLFTPVAIRLMAHASEGLTRRINILADKALLSAFSENKHQIDSKQIKVAIRDAQFNAMHPQRPLRWMRGLAVVALLGLGALIALPLLNKLEFSPAPAPQPQAETQAPSSAQVNAQLPAPPAVPQKAQTPVDAKPVPSTGVSSQATSTVKPAETVPGASGTPRSADAKTVEAAAGQPASLEERITSTHVWLKQAAGHHFFIQLLSTDAGSQRYVEAFLVSSAAVLDPAQIRVYRSNLSGRERLGVIYGEYASREAASADLVRISKLNLGSQPYLREVAKLR